MRELLTVAEMSKWVDFTWKNQNRDFRFVCFANTIQREALDFEESLHTDYTTTVHGKFRFLKFRGSLFFFDFETISERDSLSRE